MIIKAPLARNRTFRVSLNANEIQCLAATSIEEEWLWHYHYGHLNFKSLTQLRDKDLVRGVPVIVTPNRVCESYATRKQTRKMFKNRAPKRARHLLEVVHADVCGPFDVSSLGGNKYFLIFVDELSRKLWTYLLKEKNETYTNFIKLCSMAKRQSRQKLRILKTGGGGEFNSREMINFELTKGLCMRLQHPTHLNIMR